MHTEHASVTRLDNPYVQHRARTPRMRFLIAESLEANRILMSTILRSAGHFGGTVSDDAAMMEQMTSQTFDAAFIDQRIYDESLGSSVKLLRAMYAGHAHVPVVLVSGSAPLRDLRDLGVDQVLLRPFSVSKVLASITQVARWHAARLGQRASAPAAADLPVVDFTTLASHLDAGVMPVMVVYLFGSTVMDIVDRTKRIAAMPAAWRVRTLKTELGALGEKATSIGASGVAACCSMHDTLAIGGKAGWVDTLLGMLDRHVARLRAEMPIVTARIQNYEGVPR